jgi:hypothetical protein
MANAPVKWYANAHLMAMNKEIDWNSDAFKFLLLKNTYVPDQAAHDYFADLTVATNEPTVGTGGYQRIIVANAVVIEGSLVTSFDMDDFAFGTLTLASPGFRWGVLYDDTPATGATKCLIAYWDFGSDQIPSGQSVTITHPAGGPLKVTTT